MKYIKFALFFSVPMNINMSYCSEDVIVCMSYVALRVSLVGNSWYSGYVVDN